MQTALMVQASVPQDFMNFGQSISLGGSPAAHTPTTTANQSLPHIDWLRRNVESVVDASGSSSQLSAGEKADVGVNRGDQTCTCCIVCVHAMDNMATAMHQAILITTVLRPLIWVVKVYH